jgi:transcriptional regulator with XRE-family HTH domain
VQPPADDDPPDPGRVTTQQEFGRELTRARTRAQLTVRQVAKASGLPPSTAGDYFAGRHLPPTRQPDLLLRVLAACGVTDPAEVERWQQALRRVHRPPGRRPARMPVPYLGLASFGPADAGWFFGREELTLHLVRLAGGTAAAGLPLAVVGPSGSGKSSLLRAGLYPRLRAGAPARPDGRPVVLLTPGLAPVRALAQGLATLALPGTHPAVSPESCEDWLRGAPRDCAHLLRVTGNCPPAIIADQFEELFAPWVSEPERRCYLGALQALSEVTLVVFGLRADFYGHALRYPELARSLQDRQIVVGPMTARQLRRAILEPAAKAGLDVEDGLAEVVLRDLRPPWDGPAPGAGHEVGALPLLSHALLATWQRRMEGRLTIAGYQASGGFSGAVAQSAEAVYGRLGTA